MRCVLHIGAVKTGTTRLQSWLYVNQKALSEQGIYLSNEIGRPNNRLFSSYFEKGIGDWAKQNNIFTIEQKNEFFQGFLARLSEEIQRASAGHNVFVITSEHLHSRVSRAEDVRAIAEYLNANFEDVEVVCYFRNQFDMAVSHYSTALRKAYGSDVEEYVKQARPERYLYNFLQVADNWSAAFGRENCHYKIYDRARFPGGDIRKDFLQGIFPDANMEKLDFESGGSNESLSFLQACVYQSINRVVPFWDERRGEKNGVNAALKKAILKNETLGSGKITSAARSEVEGRFDDSNQKFLQKYFDASVSLGHGDGDEGREEEITYTLEEVGDLVGGLVDAILSCTLHPQTLRDEDANDLRDMAIKIEKRQTLSPADALTLMELAQRARPEGSYIARKVADYKDQLNLN